MSPVRILLISERVFARYYNLMVIVVFLELDVADGDPVSVQGNHLEKIIFYFQKFARHHLIAVIRGYGKNSLTNCFFQGKLVRLMCWSRSM